jgi:hypothetical protein
MRDVMFGGWVVMEKRKMSKGKGKRENEWWMLEKRRREGNWNELQRESIGFHCGMVG